MAILEAMNLRIPALLICLLLGASAGIARTRAARVAMIDSGRDCSIRGMSICSERVIWLSGSKGQVARSVDGGATWQWRSVPGYETTDFRDIHAFDSSRAIIMGIDNPAYLLKTVDGGRSWKVVFSRNRTGMFLDAMDFRNDREGICIGDPLDAGDGRKTFFVIRTRDGGESWQEELAGRAPTAREGEAVFSASGTNIALMDGGGYDYAFISGGAASNLYLVGREGKADLVFPLPIRKGGESAGAFSMATDRRSAFYCVGGDYKEPESVADNFAWTTDGGRSWKRAGRPPSGYRSCIRSIDASRLVACGSHGVDLSSNPQHWTRISSEGFHVCGVTPDRKRVFFAGANGKIGVMRL